MYKIPSAISPPTAPESAEPTAKLVSIEKGLDLCLGEGLTEEE